MISNTELAGERSGFLVPFRHKIVRYGIAGCIAVGTHIMVLYVLTEFLNVWYLYSSLTAFCAACVVGFLLQKFWTFENVNIHRVHKQAILHVAPSSIVCINT